MELRIERRWFPNIPWGLVVTTFILALVGVWNLASASRKPHVPVWTSQTVWIVLGVAALSVVAAVDYRWIQRMVVPIYVLNIGLLISLKFFGHRAKGAESWFALGPFRLQPAEFVKIAMVLMLAKYFHDNHRGKTDPGYGVARLFVPVGLALLPIGLVLVQPDLGTALMLFFTALSVILFAGVRWWVGGGLLACVLLGSLVIWYDYVRDAPEPRNTVVRKFLKKHQDARISGWLNPESDPRGTNYHSIQSKIAVGSGRLTGKGWMKGTQTGLFFLPEQHTDFIFSVWAEEHGFVFSLLLLLLYGFLLLSALEVAHNAREPFGAFVAVGVAAMLFWQVFENIGMVTGLLPVTGITLPLLSYGGSSMLSVMMSIGLLVNIGMRRHLF